MRLFIPGLVVGAMHLVGLEGYLASQRKGVRFRA
jgi:hypothetical protein